jgi:ribonuclease P protein component
MLSKKFRLPATTKLSQTRFFRSTVFAFKYTKNDLSVSRFAFVVRKSVDTRAVVRNRIRRVFRSCIEELKNEITLGYDMLFFLEKGIIDKQQKDLCKELKEIFREQHLLK